MTLLQSLFKYPKTPKVYIYIYPGSWSLGAHLSTLADSGVPQLFTFELLSEPASWNSILDILIRVCSWWLLVVSGICFKWCFANTKHPLHDLFATLFRASLSVHVSQLFFSNSGGVCSKMGPISGAQCAQNPLKSTQKIDSKRHQKNDAFLYRFFGHLGSILGFKLTPCWLLFRLRGGGFWGATLFFVALVFSFDFFACRPDGVPHFGSPSGLDFGGFFA